MTKSRLFGYSVDEEEGKLVITIDGLLAEGAIRQLRESAELGGGGRILQELLPVHSIYKLMSAQEKSAEETLTLEQILGQNIDQSFSDFEEQLAELRNSVSTLGESEKSEE